VYFEARKIVLLLLCRTFAAGMADDECAQSFRYEFSCWFDGMTAATMDEFCNIVQDASQASLNSLVVMAKKWEQAGMQGPVPFLPVSSILVQALRRVSCFSKSFAILTCQVGARCLLYHHDPIPLALLIAYSLDDERDARDKLRRGDAIERAGQAMTDLTAYARCLVQRDPPKEKERMHLFGSMLQSLYSSESYPSVVVNSETVQSPMARCRVHGVQGAMIREDVLSLFRLLYHLIILHHESEARARCIQSLRRLLPVVLEVRTSSTSSRNHWIRLIV